jgi:polysaccharide export outer membrane protein
MKLRRLALILSGLWLALSLGACASGGGMGASTESQWYYTLDAGDEVRIVVFGEADLSDNYRVSDNGTITMPLIGAVSTRGHTTESLAKLITEKLANGYLRDPNVRVEMVEYRPVYVLGEVQSPGKYPYEPGMTALSAAAVAGGFTYRADTDTFKVTRKFPDGHTEKGKLGPQGAVLPGDILEVPERFF